MALGADEATDETPLIPVRMLNELSFCPRLFHLEYVQGEFEDNAFTVEGRYAHRRVDKSPQAPAAPQEERPFKARSVQLASERLGISAKMDLLEGDGASVKPVDYKRGRPPENEHRAWEPERVQVCAYGLLLREHGYTCDGGVLYFAETKSRVDVPFTEELVGRTLQIIAQAKELSRTPAAPPPLRGSPKCQGCSLHAICLPDEVAQLIEAEGAAGAPVRHFAPGGDDARPLYVTGQGTRVGLSGEVLEVVDRDRKKVTDAKLIDVAQLVLYGNVQVSAQAARELMTRGVPIAWLSYGGWLCGLSDGLGHGNVELRRAQYRFFEDGGKRLRLARRIVRTKLLNSRTLLRRNHEAVPPSALAELQRLASSATEASSLQELLGVEGNGARIYFSLFAGMLKPGDGGEETFAFETRNRRPPKDPVNALLSFLYSALAREVAVAARLTGLDPFLGYYHQPRFGRPALALDLMEEFRPLLADSVVLSVINTGVVGPDDFIRHPLGVAMKDDARRQVLRAWERRLAEEVTHPVFGYRVSYRRILQVQLRLFARFLMGELPEYPEFRTR